MIKKISTYIKRLFSTKEYNSTMLFGVKMERADYLYVTYIAPTSNENVNIRKIWGNIRYNSDINESEKQWLSFVLGTFQFEQTVSHEKLMKLVFKFGG